MGDKSLGTFKHAILLAIALNLALFCASWSSNAQNQPPAAPPASPQEPAPGTPEPGTPAPPAPPPPAAAEQPPAAPATGLTPEEEQALKEAEASKGKPAASEAPLENAAKGDSEEVSEEIVITGSRISRNKKEQFAQVAVISGKEIQASGASTIDEVLN